MPARITLDEQLLIKYFCVENKTLDEIGIIMNCHRNVVTREIKRYGLERNYKDPIWLKQKHHIERLTLGQMSKLAHCNHHSITKYMRKHNLETLDEVRYSGVTKYTVDKHYFEKIDSSEKAYWLGYIVADGCITYEKCETYRLDFTISEQDREHLIQFKNAINSNAPIEERVTYLDATGKEYSGVRLRINNSHMCKSLMEIGIMPRKSGNEIFPTIDERFHKDFIRGVFDGDGCFSYWFHEKNGYQCQITIVGSYELMNDFAMLFQKKFGFSTSVRKDGAIYRISINSHNATLLLDCLYSENGVHLKRKKETFDRWNYIEEFY